MNKILVIHLKRFGDLVAAGQTIASLKQEHPHSEISLLCFDEFSNITKVIPNLHRIYTIGRNTLLTLKNGRLYNNGFALEELSLRLEPLTETRWDRIINLTNDRMSAYLTSWLATFNKNSQVNGLSMSQNGMVMTSNYWSRIFNDVLTRSGRNSPMNFRDVWAKISETHDYGNYPLLTNKKNEQAVIENFDSLRSRGGKVITIQAHCSVADKGFSAQVVADLTKRISEANDRPVLLCAPTQAERDKMQEVSKLLDFKPIIVECDFTALSSVIKHSDLVITPDTVTKHIADAHQTRCVEVSLGSSPTFKQATMNPESRLIVIRDPMFGQVSADDIYNVSAAMLNETNEIPISAHCVVYRPKRIDQMVTYQAIAGNIEIDQELDRHAMSALISVLDGDEEKDTSKFAQNVIASIESIQGFSAWAANNKDACTQVMKDLLHTIRALLQVKVNPRQARDFVQALDQLLAHTEQQVQFSNLPVFLFRSKLEAIQTSNFSANARAIEALVFELKGQIQVALGIINEWEKVWSSTKFSNRKIRFEAQL